MQSIEAATPYDRDIRPNIDRACLRIAPLWPLKHFVAVNPYFGLRDEPFWQADQTLRKITGEGLTMERSYYEEQITKGRITKKDLDEALKQMNSSWDVAQLEQAMKQQSQSDTVTPFPLFTDVISDHGNRDWSKIVVERISRYCAAYFDEGQAIWTMPWRDDSLYQGWSKFMYFDRSLRMMGLRGIKKAVAALPTTAEGAITWALGELSIPQQMTDDYLLASLLSIGGWAGWARYLRWQAELRSETDQSLSDLLAIRVCWDAILYKIYSDTNIPNEWHLMLEAQQNEVFENPSEHVDAILQTALEIGYQRSLVKSIKSLVSNDPVVERPPVQAAFCIDVRSEIIRRALETVNPGIQTLGFAGFFGVLMEYVPFGSNTPKGHLPIIFNPPYQVWEGLSNADENETKREVSKRQLRLRVTNAWKGFKTSAVSTFTFVESTGLVYIPKLFGDSMGWTRTVPHPDAKGLNVDTKQKLRPQLTTINPGSSDNSVGIPKNDLANVGGFILNNMGITHTFARLILLAGHGSTTVNNPQGTGLDCGACAGQTGEASARIAVALLNDPTTRQGLEDKGIKIPEDTYFIAGLHDTTTDEVTLFDIQDLPETHSKDLAQLRQWLAEAGELTRMQRANLLGTAGQSSTTVMSDMRRRTRDWAEVRPEWALAGNAAFIAAPRGRTKGVDLEGRTFLHDYNWRKDTGFATLELIMTAPMVVANWINMQYYGSMMDNFRFGSGNKVLHNVVGGSIGVLEGNGGDLRVGFALQSLHDGKHWVHEPVRLNVLIEAPQQEIDSIISRHVLVRELIDNSWICLFQIADDGTVNRRLSDQQWQQVE